MSSLIDSPSMILAVAPKEFCSNNINAASSLLSLSIQDIARWQIDLPATACTFVLRVALPSLQRGAVWKPRQAEALWDSLLRGFPTGGFLMAPFMDKLGVQKLKHNQIENDDQSYDYHLLDGQQRSNTIALAFLNPWKNEPEKEVNGQGATAVLWLDLSPPKDEHDERDFIFRVVTRSHPWGYRRTNPDERLEVNQRREAFATYKRNCSLEGNGSVIPGSLALQYAWPWDAEAPIPFCFLIQAVMEHPGGGKGLWSRILELCTSLPFWSRRAGSNLVATEAILHSSQDEPPAHVARIIRAISRILGTHSGKPYQIPVQILPPDVAGIPDFDSENKGELLRQDAVETLFIRVNAGGTRLEGEELNYSILKSVWPEAQRLIDELSSRLMPPSRLVMLASRLILSSNGHNDRPPPVLDVARFRRLVHGLDKNNETFLDQIRSYLKQGRLKDILADARWLLTVQPGQSAGFRLPPVLVADIARRAPDAFFLLLRWLDRMRDTNHQVKDIAPEEHKRLLGTITAISWFAQKSQYCIEALWPNLQSLPKDMLPYFFREGLLKPCLKLKDGELPLIPLVPPTVLEQGIEVRMWGHGLLGNPNTNAWTNWEWESSFIEREHWSDDLLPWFERVMKKADVDDNGGTTISESALKAWSSFANRLWGQRALVLYAQREWLCKWFPYFDPASPDQLEDTDRPWDFDHIHPHKFVNNIKNGRDALRIINTWHNSIGNLRAWPFELNRGDGDAPPDKKLTELPATETALIYGITNERALRDASAIGKHFKDWTDLTPSDEKLRTNYLRDMPEYRPRLLRAIVRRMQYLYKIWYQSFHIKDLM